MSHEDVTQARFAASAARLAELGERRIDGIRERIRQLVPLAGDERAVDAGTGTGPIAFALAPLVGSVVGIDLVPAMIEEARSRAAAYPNVELLVGDALAMPFPDGAFDLATSGRTLHHLARPEAAIRELARVVRPGGLVLVVDQIAPDGPGAAALQERIETLRDPSHVRTLADAELRTLLEDAGLRVERVEIAREQRNLGEFLALAGCEGEARARVLAVAERAVASEAAGGLALRRGDDGLGFELGVGWYVARRG